MPFFPIHSRLYGKTLLSYSPKFPPPLPRLHQYISKVSQKHRWQWQHLTLLSWQWPNLCRLELQGISWFFGPADEGFVWSDMTSNRPSFVGRFLFMIKTNQICEITVFDVSRWWFFTNPSEKYANVNLDHFPKVRDEHQEYLKPISYTVVFTEGSSTNGELVVWGPVVFESQTTGPQTTQFTTSRGSVMIKKVRAVVDMLCLIHKLFCFWRIFLDIKKGTWTNNKFHPCFSSCRVFKNKNWYLQHSKTKRFAAGGVETSFNKPCLVRPKMKLPSPNAELIGFAVGLGF